MALRSFLRDRRFALSALAAIAVSAGCATAVFSVADRSLFRPLPYRDGDRLVSVGVVAPLISTQDWLFAGTYEEWRARQTAFEGFTSWTGVVDCDWGDQRLQRLGCARAESTFLPTLGVTPVLGRNFTREEDLLGGDPVVLLTYGLWTSRFGADRNVLGTRMMLDGVPARIIGVLPPDFETPTLAPADVLLPQRLQPGAQRQRLVRAIARLPQGSSPTSADAALDPLYQAFLRSVPAHIRNTQTARLRVATLRDQQTRDSRMALWMLLGAVVAFVLIACANVANLLLARSAMRRQEFAVRLALGASRGRLVRQSLTESGVLGVVGGALGCLLAAALLRVLIALVPEGTLRLSAATVDPRVLLFALGLSLTPPCCSAWLPPWNECAARL